jgi:hypothetical protein
MTSPYWQEDQARLQRIRSLESKPNLSILDQIQLMNDRNTLQNLRSEALRESKFRIEEKESLLKERELDEAMSPQPTKVIQNQPLTPAQSNIQSLFSPMQQQMQSEPFMKIPPEIRGFDFSKDYLSRQTGQGDINDGVTYYPPPSNWMQSFNYPQFPSY